MTYPGANDINNLMENNTNKKHIIKKPTITKLGKAKELITQIPQVENKNSVSASDEFSVFTVT